jgi:phage shock protein PspC (stress-responsive transcriptional regulator)
MNDTETPPTPPPPDSGGTGPRPERRLRRSADRTVGGVAAGIAEYLGIDPTLVRLAFVALVFAGGSGVLAYLVAWLVIPGPASDDRDGSGGSGMPPWSARRTSLFIAIGIGVVLLGSGPLWWLFGWQPSAGLVVALALMAVAIALLLGREDRAVASPGDPAEPLGVASDTGSRPVAGAGAAAAPPLPPYQSAATVLPAAPRRPVTPAAPVITLTAIGAIAVALAAAGIGDAAGFWHLDLVAGFGIATVVVGVALVVSAFVGRAGALIPLGVLLVLGLVASTALDPIIEDGAGVRHHDVDDLDDLDSTYELGVGELRLDLRDLDLEGAERRVDVELGIGDVTVLVPDDVRVVVDGRVDAGQLDVFGEIDSGLGVDIRETIDGTGGVLRLRLDVGAGNGEVTR